MGLFESTRGAWRPLASTGALRAAVGVMLLRLSLGQAVPPQAACASAAAASPDISEPDYHDAVTKDTGAGFMAPLVKSFLHTVQPNPFPEDLILGTINSLPEVLSNQELIDEALQYEVGFLVCVAIGILYIVLMPLLGFCVACCRCCGNCGGTMYQKQTSSTDCRRRFLYWSTLVTTVIIFAANVCMFKSNGDLKVSVDKSPVQFNQALGNIESFITAIPEQLNAVVKESSGTVQEVTGNLDNIGPQLGAEIQRRFSVMLEPALQPVRRLDQETKTLSAEVTELSLTLAELQTNVDLLQNNILAVRNSIDQTLSKPECVGCQSLRPELQALDPDIGVTVPSLTGVQSSVDEVTQTNLAERIQEVETYFNNIPQTVIRDTKDVVQSSKETLSNIEAQISQVTDKLPISDLNDLLAQISKLKKQIDSFSGELGEAEYIRWCVCVAICCVVLLVVVCNVLALILGPLGLSPSADPTKRSLTSDCAGTLLMIGAGFSFLFSWLFMVVVVLLFLLGGNISTLFIDSLPISAEISQAVGPDANIDISTIYGQCEENAPLWTTLQLHKRINLDDLLNVSKYTEQIQAEFDKADITLSKVTLLSPEVKEKLSNFPSKIDGLSSTAIDQQISEVSKINLNTTAEKLESAATQMTGEIAQELRAQAKELRRIQASIETSTIPLLKSVSASLEQLRVRVEAIDGTVGEVLKNVGAAQDFLNTETAKIVESEGRKFLDCQLGYFVAYADWAKRAITQQVGRCKPVAGAFNSAEIIVCEHVAESLNAFWCSLGWCMIFFIPSIIFSMKLAKYYRRMKRSDVYDESIVLNNIPRAQMKFF